MAKHNYDECTIVSCIKCYNHNYYLSHSGAFRKRQNGRTHGKSAYEGGCRCDVCVSEWHAYYRAYRKRYRLAGGFKKEAVDKRRRMSCGVCGVRFKHHPLMACWREAAI